MVKHCEKCGKKLNQEAFICPHCGHILGTPVHAVPKNKSRRKLPWRKLLGAVGLVILILGLLAAAWGISRFVEDLAATVPTTAPTEPPTTLAPLVNYRVELSADTKYWLDGITVHFCKDGQALYAGEVDADGKITFIAPKGEGYSIRLSGLFPALDYHYGNIDIPFPEGTNILRYHLANKDIHYAVRVVNTAGEPVPDVKVEFNAHNGKFIKDGLTDSDGEAFFKSSYDPLCYATMLSVPDEYILVDTRYSYEFGSFVTEIVLMTYEECHVGPENLFTIRVRDEYGQPVKDLFVIIYGQIGDDVTTWESIGCFTNQQGNITFTGTMDYSFQVRIPYNPDYADIRFPFEEGSHELDIQLLLHTPLPEYTYTIQFQDQNGQPIADVKVAVPTDEKLLYFTSDQDGIITFQSQHRDPSEIYFVIASAPAGYGYTNGDEMEEYSFPANSRNMVMTLLSSVLEYSIFLHWDPPGGRSTKIIDAEFDIIIHGKRYLCRINELGHCKVELPRVVSNEQFSFDFSKLPEKYQPYIFYYSTVLVDGDTRIISFHIGPMPEEEVEYRVTVYVPGDTTYEPLQGVRLHLIYEGERYADETGADGSCWPPLPQITDFSQLRVELISLPEAYQDYVVWDYSLNGNEILIFLGPAPEPPVESP